MIKNKRILISLSALFAITEIIFAVLIQKISGDANRYISYASVVLACLFLLLFAEKTWEYLFTQAALIMTLCADYFLVLPTEIKQFPAMIFFSIAQLSYFMRLYTSTEKKSARLFHVVVRFEASLFAVILTFIVLRHLVDPVSVVSMFYFTNLLINIIFAFSQFKKNYLFAIGLLFFACCDLLIGFSFLENYLEIEPDTIAYKLAHPGCNLAWIFYVPSQMLIALSLLPQRLKNKKA